MVAGGRRGVDLLLHIVPSRIFISLSSRSSGWIMPAAVNDSCMRRMPFRSPFDYFMGQLWGLNHKPSRLFHEKRRALSKSFCGHFFLSATQYISLTSIGGHFIFGLVSYVGVVRKNFVSESKRYSRGGSTVSIYYLLDQKNTIGYQSMATFQACNLT